MKYKNSNSLFRLTGLLTLIWLFFVPAQLYAASISEDETHIFLENDHVIFKISKRGRSDSFVLIGTGEELVSNRIFFAYYREHFDSSRSEYHNPQEIEYVGTSCTEGKLTVKFRSPDATAIPTISVRCTAYDTYFLFELTKIEITPPPADEGFIEVAFARIRIDADENNGLIGSSYKRDFIINELALNIETRIYRNRGALQASGYSHIQLPGQEIALITCPESEWLSLVGDIELLHGLPHPTIDGTWAKRHPDMNTSYLFVDITEENADDIVEYALRGHFKYILTYWRTWAKTYGSYQINESNYPGGLRGPRSLKSVVDKVHCHGLKFGLHTMSALIQPGDAYVKPIPDPRLAKESPISLRDNIYPEVRTDFIYTTTPPTDYIEYFSEGDREIIIEDEIIRCAGVDTEPPDYGFRNCRRGVIGTTAAAHDAGVAINHLPKSSSGAYLPDLSTDLLDEIAQNVTDTYNAVGGDFLYLDGLGQLDSQTWYACPLAASKYFDRLTRDALIESSCPSHFNWHILSRGVSGDRAFIGVKPYMDGFKIPLFHRRYRKAFFPQELGWIGLFSKIGRASDASFSSTTVDEIEYQMNRGLGYNLPISLETTYKALQENGFTKEILDLISIYEKLRLTDYFPSCILRKLQQSGKEYHLVKNENDVYGFKERAYAEHYVADAAGDTWVIENTFPKQPLKVKITAIQPNRSYDDEGNIVLEDFSNIRNLKVKKGRDITCEIEECIEEGTGRIVATNGSKSNYGWCKITKTLDEDLSNHKAIGMTVTGDGKEEVISIQLDPEGRLGNRQYQFRVDFAGTEYKELAIPTTTELFQYPYESGRFPTNLKNSFRPFDYESTNGLTIYIKNIPPGDKIDITLGAIKALRQDPLPINNPSLTVGGRTITFPTTLQSRCINDEGIPLEPCEYLVFDGKTYRKYDGNNNLIESGKPDGKTPIVSSGRNTITYSSGTSSGIYSNKALVTILTEGEPFYPGDYYIWFNPLNFLPDFGSNLSIAKGQTGHSIRITTDTTGDLQWISLGLTVPSNIEIKQVKLHYKLSNSRSFISQVRLTETTDPPTAIVRHDDGTDLTSTTATVYHSHVSNLQPNGSITLALRLNFADISDVIEIGGIGILVDEF